MKRFLFLVVLVLALLPFVAYKTFAQPGMVTSSARTVAFAFYKMAKAQPNFERWVKNTEPYTKAPMAKRPKVYDSEHGKLITAFNAYNPDEDLLVVKTFAKARVKVPDDKEAETLTLEYEFHNANSTDELFFPFEFAGDNYAVLNNDIEQHRVIELPIAQFEYLKGQLRSNAEISVIFQLRPIKADANEPYLVKGVSHWLLLTDIASLTLWSKSGRLLHEYTAPWYFSPLKQDLTELKSKKPVTVIEENPIIPINPPSLAP